jgi:hypothetical protein
MDVSSSSETSVYFQRATRSCVLGDRTHCSYHCEILNPAVGLKRSQAAASLVSDVSASKEEARRFAERIFIFPKIWWLDIHQSVRIWVDSCTLFPTDGVSQIQFSHNLWRMQKVTLLDGWLLTTFQRKKNNGSFLGTHLEPGWYQLVYVRVR